MGKDKAYLIVLGGAVASVVLVHTAFGALTGAVTIYGKVPELCELTAVRDTNGHQIDDISQQTSNHLIAKVTESCNRNAGYTVVMEGDNSGSHQGLFREPTYYSAGNLNAQQAFKVFYNGTEVVAGGVVTNVNAPVFNAEKEVRISFEDNSALPSTAGYTYEETLTFTMSPK